MSHTPFLPTPGTRREFLRQTFAFSAALGIGPLSRNAFAAPASAADLHFLAIGDFGSANEKQSAVAAGMKRYIDDMQRKPEGMFLLGDNFYSKMPGGVKSPRWQAGFEEMYPASHFPGPCWAILGNHDYHDNAGGEQTQLAYAAATPGTRWTMPAKWFRFELRGKDGAAPVATVLCLDSNLPLVSGVDKKTGKKRNSLTEAEAAAQQNWLKAELTKPRAPFTFVLAHHPLYSNGSHGDTKPLIAWLDPLLREHGVQFFIAGHDHDLQRLEFEGHPTSFVGSGGGGARTRELKNAQRGPFGQTVYGFTHLQLNAGRVIIRHLDANRKLLHGFSKTPDGKVASL